MARTLATYCVADLKAEQEFSVILVVGLWHNERLRNPKKRR